MRIKMLENNPLNISYLFLQNIIYIQIINRLYVNVKWK